MTTGLDFLSTIINNVPHQFAEQLVSTWNRECPVFGRIRKVAGSSDNIYYTLNPGGSTAGLIAEGDDVVSANEDTVDTRLAITLPRAQYRAAFSITTHELRVVRSLNPSVTSNGIVNRLMMAWLENAAGLGRFLEKKLFYGLGAGNGISRATGGACNDMEGLVNALQTGVYGGQTFTGNQAATLVNVGGALTRAHFNTAVASLNNKTGGITPDFWLCNPTTLANAVLPIVDADVRDVSALNFAVPYKIGPSQIMRSQVPVATVHGVPVFTSSALASVDELNNNAPIDLDGYIFGGRWEDMEYNYLPEPTWGDAVGEGHISTLSGFAGAFDSLGIPVLSYARAKTGASVKFAMEGEGGLRLNGLNRFIMMYGATV